MSSVGHLSNNGSAIFPIIPVEPRKKQQESISITIDFRGIRILKILIVLVINILSLIATFLFQFS